MTISRTYVRSDPHPWVTFWLTQDTLRRHILCDVMMAHPKRFGVQQSVKVDRQRAFEVIEGWVDEEELALPQWLGSKEKARIVIRSSRHTLGYGLRRPHRDPDGLVGLADCSSIVF